MNNMLTHFYASTTNVWVPNHSFEITTLESKWIVSSCSLLAIPAADLRTLCCILVFASQHFSCFITHNNKQQPQHFYCCPFNEGFPQIGIFIVNLDSSDRCLDIIIKETFSLKDFFSTDSFDFIVLHHTFRVWRTHLEHIRFTSR